MDWHVKRLHWRARRCGRLLREQLARPHPCPVLVFGNQKSGTSAIAGMLAEVTRVPAAIDLVREYQSPSYPDVVRGARSARWFIRRNRLEFSRGIVKEPNFLVMWKQLLAELPDSPRILVVRDPRDNLRSILDRLELPGDRDELTREERGANGPGWSLYLDGRWLGIDSDHYVEVMAHRWNLGYRFLEENRDRVVLVRYEDFLLDKEGTLAGLAARVGLPVRRPLGAAAEHQYQPRGSRRRGWHEVFGKANLARIERICGRGMRELGYEPVV